MMRDGWTLGAYPNQVRRRNRKSLATNVAQVEFVKNEVDSLDEIPLGDFLIESIK